MAVGSHNEKLDILPRHGRGDDLFDVAGQMPRGHARARGCEVLFAAVCGSSSAVAELRPTINR